MTAPRISLARDTLAVTAFPLPDDVGSGPDLDELITDCFLARVRLPDSSER